jgi:hypothetical protein
MPVFYSPKTIVQYAEYPDINVSWTNNDVDKTILDQPEYNFADTAKGAGNRNVIETVRSLTHVSNLSFGPKLDKTYYLKCTNFGFNGLTDALTGIMLTLDTQRFGKIVDDTICLVYKDQVISKNKTDLSTHREGQLRNGNVQIYGGETDLWDAELTNEMVMDPSFGVLLRFASNPLYPHREGMLVYNIILTAYPDNYFIEDPDSDLIYESEELSGNSYFISEQG